MATISVLLSKFVIDSLNKCCYSQSWVQFAAGWHEMDINWTFVLQSLLQVKGSLRLDLGFHSAFLAKIYNYTFSKSRETHISSVKTVPLFVLERVRLVPLYVLVIIGNLPKYRAVQWGGKTFACVTCALGSGRCGAPWLANESDVSCRRWIWLIWTKKWLASGKPCLKFKVCKTFSRYRLCLQKRL
jgi:hypothetical protein